MRLLQGRIVRRGRSANRVPRVRAASLARIVRVQGRCYGPATPRRQLHDKASEPPRSPDPGRRHRRRSSGRGSRLDARFRARRRARALPRGQDRLEAGRGRDDHGRGDPGELLREPDLAATAVRGADRNPPALREGAAGADPPEGAARPLVEDGDLRDARGRSDVLPALRLQQVGRAARQVPRRRDAHRQVVVRLRRHHQGVARRRLGRRQAVRNSVRRRGDGAGLPQGPLRRERPQGGRHLRRAGGEREGADRRQCAHLRARVARLRGRRPEHVHLPVDLPRLRRQLDARQPGRRQFARGSEGARAGTSTC